MPAGKVREPLKLTTAIRYDKYLPHACRTYCPSVLLFATQPAANLGTSGKITHPSPITHHPPSSKIVPTKLDQQPQSVESSPVRCALCRSRSFPRGRSSTPPLPTKVSYLTELRYGTSRSRSQRGGHTSVVIGPCPGSWVPRSRSSEGTRLRRTTRHM